MYSGDLHAVHYVTEDSFLVIQFPIALLAVMGELNRILPQLSRCNCVRHVPGDAASEAMLRCVRDIDACCHSGDPFREVRACLSSLPRSGCCACPPGRTTPAAPAPSRPI